jgi:predicted ATPase
MQIEKIIIKNYRLFRSAELKQLSHLNLVVGPNGSGKSTLLDIFSFLQEALMTNVEIAIASRGGFRELVSRGERGPIVFEIHYRDNSGKLAIYELKIVKDARQSHVDREVLKLYSEKDAPPLHLIDFSHGSGMAIINNAGSNKNSVKAETKTFVLDDPNVLAIKGLGQFKDFSAISEFRHFIENWHISKILLDDARSISKASYSKHLSTHGDNLASVARFLFENHPECIKRIIHSLKERIPGIDNVDVKHTEDGRLVLRFQDANFHDPFISRYISDGTLKMFAYLILLYDPTPNPLLAIEEPEFQLYPELLYELIEEFRDYARRGGQIFVSTHSPEFLNGAQLEEIYWLKKTNGFTEIQHASESELLKNLVIEGDLPGTLWKQGLFEGANL